MNDNKNNKKNHILKKKEKIIRSLFSLFFPHAGIQFLFFLIIIFPKIFFCKPSKGLLYHTPLQHPPPPSEYNLQHLNSYNLFWGLSVVSIVYFLFIFYSNGAATFQIKWRI
jgi:hypothetical protein